MKNFDLENVDCHATLAMTEKRWGFPRRTLRALLGMTENTQSGRSLLAESGADAQSGRSMIEMLGVLAIIGVLSVGGIAGYSKAMQKYRINKAIEQITLIAGNIRTFFATQSNYFGAYCSCGDNSCSGYDSDDGSGHFFSDHNGCPIIKKAKILPDEMITVNADGKITSITNPFGGELSIDAYSGGHTVSKNGKGAFDIHLYSIPEDACIELLSYDWSTSNATYVCTIAPYPQCTSTPADIDKVMTICTKEAYRNRISIQFDGYYNYETDFY